jgi:hypothetical protein
MAEGRRRWLPLWLKRSLIVLACLPIALPVLALTVLAVPVTRRPIVKLALELTNPALSGMRIELDEATRLDLWGIELRGARLFDEKKREMVSLKRAFVRIAPLSLLGGTLRLPEVQLEGGRVHLFLDAEPEPEEPEEPDSGPMTFQIVGEALHVRDVTLDMPLLDKALHASLSELDGAGAYGPSTRGVVRNLKLSADLDGQRAATLHSRYADWNEKSGGKTMLSGELAGAALRIAAQVPPIDDAMKWPVVRASIDLNGLTQQGLARLGLAELVQLKVPVDLHVQAETQGKREEQLAADLTLQAGATKLQLTARATATSYAAHVLLPPVELASLAGVLPALHVGGELYVEARHDPRPMRAELWGRDLVFDRRAVPNLHLVAELPFPVLQLKQLEFAGLSHALSLTGEYNLDSAAAQVSLETQEFDLASLGGLVPLGTQGTLNGGLRAKLAGTQQLSGKSDLSLRYFRLDQLGIDNAQLSLDLTGKLTEPRGHVKLGAYQVKNGATRVLKAELDAQAGLHDVKGDLSVEGVDRFLSLVLSGKRADDGSMTLDAQGQGRIKDKQLGLSLVQLKLGARGGYQVRELVAFSGKERIYVSGSLSANNQLDAAVEIDALDLEPIGRLVLEYPLTGQLSLRARAQGPLLSPDFKAQLKLHAVHSERTPRAPHIDLETELGLDMTKREATIALHAHSQDRRVELKLTAKAELAKRTRQLLAAFERAKLALDLVGHSDVGFLGQFATPHLDELEGDVNLDLSISGTLDDAQLDTKVVANVVPTAERTQNTPDRIELAAALRSTTLDVSLAARDKFGKVLEASSNLKLPEGGVRGIIARGKALVHTPASLEVLLNERRFDKLQGSLGLLARKYGAALPVRAAAQVALESSGDGITGNVNVRAHVWGEGLDDACPETAEGDLSLQADLAGDQIKAQLTAKPKAGGEAIIDLRSKLLVNDLLDGSAFGWGPGHIDARGHDLRLNSMPTLCSLPPSRTGFELTADELGAGPVISSLRLSIDDVPTPEGPKLGLALRANTNKDLIAVQGELKLGGTVKGKLSASLPLAYGATPVPSLPLDKPVRADVDLPDFPVSGLTAFTSLIGRAGGRLGAKLRVTGTLQAPQPSGTIELRRAAFSIASLAQPFGDVNGRIELTPDKVVIRELKARDRDGKLGLVGYAQYNMARGGAAELHLSATKFPIRQQGSIVGELTTRAKLSGKIDPGNKLALTLDIHGGRVWLTGEGGQGVQDREEHPDVRFDTEQLKADGDDEEEKEPALTLALLRIRSDADLWLMHDDFSVQVGVDMKLTSDGDGATLQGEATITRGDLNLLGKPFRIEKGAVRFTGDVPPDPELDLKAKHTTRAGREVIVQIQGRASAPQIIFSGAANNAGEAAALLSGLGSSGAESKAKTDAASFAAGLTAGLLAVSARRKFGDWVPMLAIENDASGAPSGARAGFDASRLIPKFMRGFARSMYVEGVVGAAKNDAGSRSVGVGVRVEVALPQDFMTSMGYGPGTVWSTDVYWSP